MASNLGRKVKVAVLQPFLKTTAVVGRRSKRPGQQAVQAQDQPRPSVSLADARSKLDEAVALVDTLGCEVVLQEVIPLRTVNAKFLFGSGKVSEMSGVVRACDADAVFVNAPLSGLQQKALGEKWGGATVLDRFRVILDIFADRARTTDAKLQVELAQLKYSAAHLVQSGAAGRDSGYDRQGGGKGAMGGAGEKELEIQRRLLRDRAAEVGKLLKEVEKRRGVQRRTRDRRREPTVALVGYTNVGKSSLLNRLSFEGKGASGSRVGKGRSGGIGGKGSVHSQDRVFDTLDPTSRSITLPSMARCVLVDTVGFIQDLPTALVHSFRATLDEVQRADVLLHVRDASLTPRISEAHRAAVEETLRELEALDIPTLEVWNKSDKEQEVDVDEHGNGAEELEPSSPVYMDVESIVESIVDPRNVLCVPSNKGRDRSHTGARRDGNMSYPHGRQQEEERVEVEATRPGGSESEEPNDMDPSGDPIAVHKGPVPASALPGAGCDAIRVSASTGEGLAILLARVDALLHLGDNPRLAPPPSQRYRYVQILPGQEQLSSKTSVRP